MQTEKLYYQDPYIREFTAKILENTALKDNHHALILDRTSFYPEGGGQPCDLGTLNEIPVLDVRTENGQIIHITNGDPGVGDVKGKIDWQRRFDHMQQHTGEHILSGIFLSLYQAENVGFHLSDSTCQIDVTLPAVSPELINIVDIAHALPMICRGNGQVSTFWSVGEHCILCAKEAAARGYSNRVIEGALLHDASECYMSDVPRPLKQFMTVYKEQENHLLDVLYTKFLGSPLDEQEEKLIKEIDDAVLWYDMKYLLGEDSEGDKPETCMVPDYTVRAFKDVEQEYLEIFEKYKVL